MTLPPPFEIATFQIRSNPPADPPRMTLGRETPVKPVYEKMTGRVLYTLPHEGYVYLYVQTAHPELSPFRVSLEGCRKALWEEEAAYHRAVQEIAAFLAPTPSASSAAP